MQSADDRERPVEIPVLVVPGGGGYALGIEAWNQRGRLVGVHQPRHDALGVLELDVARELLTAGFGFCDEQVSALGQTRRDARLDAASNAS